MIQAATVGIVVLAVSLQTGAPQEDAAVLLDAMPTEATSVVYLDFDRLGAEDSPWRTHLEGFAGTAHAGDQPLHRLIERAMPHIHHAVIAGSAFEMPTNPNFNRRAIIVLNEEIEGLADLPSTLVPPKALVTHEADGITIFEWIRESQHQFQGNTLKEPVFATFPNAHTLVLAESLAEAVAISTRLSEPKRDDPGPWSPLTTPEEIAAPAVLVRRCGVRYFEEDNPPVMGEEPDHGVMTAPESARVALTFRYEGESALDMYEAMYGLFHFDDEDDVRRGGFISGRQEDDGAGDSPPDWSFSTLYDLFGMYVWMWWRRPPIPKWHGCFAGGS